MKFEQAYERTIAGLGIAHGLSADRIRETEFAEAFWRALTTAADNSPKSADPRVTLLLEHALIWRILAYRLETAIARPTHAPDTDTTKTHTRTGRIPAVQTLNALAETHERLRKIMKELMELLGADSDTEKVGLGMLLVPLLEKTEGVLEEILEDEAREKASAKNKSKQKRKGRVAQATPAHAVR